MSQVELSKKVSVAEALNYVRQELANDGTIFVCGTSPMISRGISMVSKNLEQTFLYPPTLVIMATPLGRSLEEYYQGLNRGTGDFLNSIEALRQVLFTPTPMDSPCSDWLSIHQSMGENL